MPRIPYPNVPDYPGVPSVPRQSPGSPTISISLATPANSRAQAARYADAWGIFDADTGEDLYAPNSGTLSFSSISYGRQMQISDFPIEANADGQQGAAFASFNKVFQPANPVVTFALSGPATEQAAFLTALDAATTSTNLYNVVTPQASYLGYSIESYSYQRTAQRGATLLVVEISLKQILEVSASYANTPINSPQSPSAENPVNNGLIQGEQISPAIQAMFPNVKIIGIVP